LAEKIILGAGRHAAETYCLIEDLGMGKDVIAFAKDISYPGEQLLGKNVISIPDVLEQYKMAENKPAVLVAIGNVEVNKRLVQQFRAVGFPFFSAINKDLVLERQKYIGEGVTIAAGTIFTCDISVGDYTIINIGCTISHDCVIGKHVNISPGCHLAGNVHIEDDVFVGTGVTFIPKVKVGKGSIIAAGACIVKDVPAYSMVAGVPGIIKKKLSA
jgi:acetyltransferase EpsM